MKKFNLWRGVGTTLILAILASGWLLLAYAPVKWINTYRGLGDTVGLSLAPIEVSKIIRSTATPEWQEPKKEVAECITLEGFQNGSFFFKDHGVLVEVEGMKMPFSWSEAKSCKRKRFVATSVTRNQFQLSIATVRGWMGAALSAAFKIESLPGGLCEPEPEKVNL